MSGVATAWTLAESLGAWVHDLSPYLLRLGSGAGGSGGLGLRWYGLSYVAAFGVAWLVVKAMARRGLVRIPPERVTDAFLLLMLGVMVGGRLGYCLFYRPGLLLDFGGGFPFWGVLRLNEGGMASHGGLIGVILAAWRISRGWPDETGAVIGRCPRLHVMDAMALVAPAGLFLGRLANFINGELLGRVVAAPGERAPWWSVRYPQELLEGSRGPTLTGEQELSLVRLMEDVAPGAPPTTQLAEIVRRVQAGAADVTARVEPLLSARHPSQLYQAAAEGLVVGAAVWWAARRPRRPGVVGAWFLIVYGVLRVVTELWRLPDAHFSGSGFFDLTSPRPLGLSRGQWLSVLMVVCGVVLLVWRSVRADERYLGWAGPGGGPVGGRAEPARPDATGHG